jgi:hypothetical protein
MDRPDLTESTKTIENITYVYYTILANKKLTDRDDGNIIRDLLASALHVHGGLHLNSLGVDVSGGINTNEKSELLQDSSELMGLSVSISKKGHLVTNQRVSGNMHIGSLAESCHD